MTGPILVGPDDVILIQGCPLPQANLEGLADSLRPFLGFRPHLVSMEAPGAAVTVLRGIKPDLSRLGGAA